jgi:hypothetical protein
MTVVSKVGNMVKLGDKWNGINLVYPAQKGLKSFFIPAV